MHHLVTLRHEDALRLVLDAPFQRAIRCQLRQIKGINVVNREHAQSGLKARNVIAWAEAHRAEAQENEP